MTAKARDKFTRYEVERYSRLLKTATDKQRRNYLSRLILEEQQKQKDAGETQSTHIEEAQWCSAGRRVLANLSVK